MQWFQSLGPVQQAFLAGLFTWVVTAAGASLVFFLRSVDDRVMASMNGFAGGVMLAASYWSLLAPAIELAAEGPLPVWVPPMVGFLAGGAVLALVDRLLPHLHPGLPMSQAEGVRPERHSRTTLLVLAITLHNVPEGLAVGVAFGAAALELPSATFEAAVVLALGIGLQNFPEGAAVAIPLRAAGASRWRAFRAGQLSAVVEPIAAVVAAVAVLAVRGILPYALAFAAGAMVFVVVEELIPEAQSKGHGDIATGSLLLGFTVMMVLDVALG
mgnify:CR=1 FL=1